MRGLCRRRLSTQTSFGRVEMRPGSLTLTDWRQWLRGEARGRALVSYVPGPVLDSAVGIRPLAFSNHGISCEIVRTLNTLGLSVDLVDCSDTSRFEGGVYDMWIQHGGANYEALRAGGNSSERLVYLSTGAYWRFHNESSETRAEAFYERHGVRLAPERTIGMSEDAPLSDAGWIIGIGNAFTRATYSAHSRVWMLPNASYGVDGIASSDVWYPQQRRDFVFCAGGGSIHKGLDLVLECFAHRREHLYLMCRIDPGFRRFYGGLLDAASNIHELGFVNPRSRHFTSVGTRCLCTLLPSCSEGQPGSVVEMMARGCIPVVSRESGLDVDRFGILLEESSIDALDAAVSEALAWSQQDLRLRVHELDTTVRARHTPLAFRSALASALNDVLET
jgi:glycosyltransferase involved in cell wall biosynthesis